MADQPAGTPPVATPTSGSSQKPSPGQAVQPLSTEAAQQVADDSGGSGGPDVLRTIEVAIDGIQSLFLQYDRRQVHATIDFSVGFSELHAAATDATFSLGTEMLAIEPKPSRPQKPKVPKMPKDPGHTSPTGPPWQ
jgi:hypothetical protein